MSRIEPCHRSETWKDVFGPGFGGREVGRDFRGMGRLFLGHVEVGAVTPAVALKRRSSADLLGPRPLILELRRGRNRKFGRLEARGSGEGGLGVVARPGDSKMTSSSSRNASARRWVIVAGIGFALLIQIGVATCVTRMTASHCRAAAECSMHGQCTFSFAERECVVGSDEDCEQSDPCRTRGSCTFSPTTHQCVIAGKDCERLDICTERGRCAALEGKCTFSDEGCRRLRGCEMAGSCSASPEGCIVGRDVDCKSSWRCRSDGECQALRGYCRVSRDEDCRVSRLCPNDGLCTAVPAFECTPTKDDDCVRCGPPGADCDGANVGMCIATSEEDCRRSESCRSEGACGLLPDHTCGAVVDADCRSRRACTESGRCVADSGKCKAMSDDECRKSPACTESGQCFAVSGKCKALDDDDCFKSRGIFIVPIEIEGRAD